MAVYPFGQKVWSCLSAMQMIDIIFCTYKIHNLYPKLQPYEVKIVPAPYSPILALNKDVPLQYPSVLLDIIKLPELSLFVKDRDLLWTFIFGAILK